MGRRTRRGLFNLKLKGKWSAASKLFPRSSATPKLDAECPIPRNPKVVCGARVVGRFLFYLNWKVGFEGVIVGSLISRKTRHPKSAKYWVGVSAPRRIENIDFPRSRSWSGPGAALASPRRDLSICAAEGGGLSQKTTSQVSKVDRSLGGGFPPS